MFIDAHVHIDEYRKNLNTALNQIRSNQILTLAVSMDTVSYKRAQKIATTCNYILPSFGIHPWRAMDFHDRLEALDPLVSESPMIGEIGLDHHFVKDTSAYPHQNQMFDYFLDAASGLEKIVNLHTSGAEHEVIRKLEEYHISHSIVHWYNGPLELIDRYLSAGTYFTIGVEILFSKGIRTILEAIPNDRLLTETDNPGGYKWLCRETGMPDLIKRVVTEIARHKKIDESDVISLVSDNFWALAGQNTHLKEKVHFLNHIA